MEQVWGSLWLLRPRNCSSGALDGLSQGHNNHSRWQQPRKREGRGLRDRWLEECWAHIISTNEWKFFGWNVEKCGMPGSGGVTRPSAVGNRFSFARLSGKVSLVVVMQNIHVFCHPLPHYNCHSKLISQGNSAVATFKYRTRFLWSYDAY